MSIKAVFLLGQTEITVNGLHQWDYGQQLEIHAPDLPALVEVHFACIGMKEAVVRPCSVVEGVGTVTIPDACLEQSAPITAWIYEINGSTGTTVKTIVLKVTERARPASTEDIPVEVADKYTEAVTAMNEQVQALKDGETIVKKALQADKATEADSAAKISVPDYGEVEGSYLVDVKNGDQAVPKADIAQGVNLLHRLCDNQNFIVDLRTESIYVISIYCLSNTYSTVTLFIPNREDCNVLYSSVAKLGGSEVWVKATRGTPGNWEGYYYLSIEHNDPYDLTLHMRGIVELPLRRED